MRILLCLQRPEISHQWLQMTTNVNITQRELSVLGELQQQIIENVASRITSWHPIRHRLAEKTSSSLLWSCLTLNPMEKSGPCLLRPVLPAHYCLDGNSWTVRNKPCAKHMSAYRRSGCCCWVFSLPFTLPLWEEIQGAFPFGGFVDPRMVWLCLPGIEPLSFTTDLALFYSYI
jgi:hypothetical protein